MFEKTYDATRFSPLYETEFESDVQRLLSLFPNGVIAFDLETTGLSPMVDQIIEIGAVKIKADGGLTCFETLIDPKIKIPENTIRIHGITNEMVADAPGITTALEQFSLFTENLPLIAHNAKFDVGFFAMQLQKHALPMTRSQVYCSCKWARSLVKNVKNHKLSELALHFQIPLLHHHRALDDAFASMLIFARASKVIDATSQLSKAHLYNMENFDPSKMEELPAPLKKLEEWVAISATIEIKYAGGSYKNQFRPVKILSLLNTPDGNVLYAYCYLGKMHKTFKISKILEVRSMNARDLEFWLKK